MANWSQTACIGRVLLEQVRCTEYIYELPSSRCMNFFINIYFGNLETINLLLITVYPYVSTNECDAVARPIPLPIYPVFMLHIKNN